MTHTATVPMPLREPAHLINPPPSGDPAAVPAGLQQAPDGTGLSIRVVDETSAPGLAVRAVRTPPGSESGSSPDLLAGHELWHPITDTVVVAGLRETGAASRLLQLLPAGELNRVLLRMATPDSTAAGAGATLGTLCGLLTLTHWPQRQRQELVGRVAVAAERALHLLPRESRGGTAMALSWVCSLARSYPDDPLVLAPLLLQLRLIGAGHPYVVPPGWPSAHLRGAAVRVVAADTPLLGGGLGAADVDRDGFVSALTVGHATEPVEPSAYELTRAAELASQLASQVASQVANVQLDQVSAPATSSGPHPQGGDHPPQLAVLEP
jgi:hypothetical protein